MQERPAELDEFSGSDRTMSERIETYKSELAHVGSVFYRHGWMLGTAGNLSARLGAGDRYVVTASGGHKGELAEHDFVSLQLGLRDATPEGRRYSAETVVHDRLYAEDDSIGSILHIHGPFVTLVSRLARESGFIDVSGFEYVKGLGFWDEGARVTIPVVPNHHDIPSLAEAVVNAKTAVPGVLVDSHGLYAWGADIRNARAHVECIEFLAQMIWREAFGG